MACKTKNTVHIQEVICLWETSGNIQRHVLGVRKWPFIQWVEMRNGAQSPTMHRIAPTTKRSKVATVPGLTSLITLPPSNTVKKPSLSTIKEWTTATTSDIYCGMS